MLGEIEATESWTPRTLRRVEMDAEIDVVLVSMYWHRPSTESSPHPLKDLTRDVVFCAQKVGAGLELDIERFKRKVVDEEKKRQVLGQSVWRTAPMCQKMVQAAEPQRAGRSDADLLASVLATRPELAMEWISDTRHRYLQAAAKTTSKSKTILSRW